MIRFALLAAPLLLIPAAAAPAPIYEVRRSGENVDFFVNGKLFTRYDTTTGPNKPYFYPVNAPGGRPITRHWPLEPDKIAGETTDHPHHRGMWFTHGALNGVDFWTEGRNKGRTVHRGYERIEGGSVCGRMVARTDWIDPTGKKIAEDRRDVRVYAVPRGYRMDFEIAIKAVNGPLVWGDTKEGTFAIRLADSMRVNSERGEKGEGHIVTAVGDKDAAAWGKPAVWVDYYGPVDGQTVGVAIFDHPGNLRHPTTWMVRDYGLFAANPFGLHDFNRALRNNPRAGEHVTPAGETTTFRYRIYVHEGDTKAADVAAVWSAFASRSDPHPPAPSPRLGERGRKKP